MHSGDLILFRLPNCQIKNPPKFPHYTLLKITVIYGYHLLWNSANQNQHYVTSHTCALIGLGQASCQWTSLGMRPAASYKLVDEFRVCRSIHEVLNSKTWGFSLKNEFALPVALAYQQCTWIVNNTALPRSDTTLVWWIPSNNSCTSRRAEGNKRRLCLVTVAILPEAGEQPCKG